MSALHLMQYLKHDNDHASLTRQIKLVDRHNFPTLNHWSSQISTYCTYETVYLLTL